MRRAWPVICALLLAAPPAIALPDITPAQRVTLASLVGAADDGLNPADYDAAGLAVQAADGAGEQFSVRLESARRAWLRDLNYGRVTPGVADADWHIPLPTRVADIDTLADAAAGPPHPDYARLRAALRTYLDAQHAGGWPTVPPGPELRVGMRDPRVDLARRRLRMTGDFRGEVQADALFFGASLDGAVRYFQARHGLVISGVIDAPTRDAMNVPAEARIAQIGIAMERWRWLPRDLGDEYVWVNTPRLTLRVVESGVPVLRSRTIVGHSTRPTPSLASDISRIVFNPTWSVPTSIAREDLLPKIQHDPGFLERNGFSVYRGWGANAQRVDPATVDWSHLGPDRLPYRFVQAPGPGNSLGLIKIAFNNPYDIYLHDTPSKGLFSLRTRMFSSGCVRLEQASKVADFLLSGRAESGRKMTADWLLSPATRTVRLTRPIPIYIVYMTVWVDDAGAVQFRRDLYGRDRTVASALGLVLHLADVGAQRAAN